MGSKRRVSDVQHEQRVGLYFGFDDVRPDMTFALNWVLDIHPLPPPRSPSPSQKQYYGAPEVFEDRKIIIVIIMTRQLFSLLIMTSNDNDKAALLSFNNDK